MGSNDILYCFVNFNICFIGSCFIGYSLGVLTAVLYKHVEFKNHKLAAVSLFVSTVYIPFLLSEVLQLSGIVTILFSGIASRRYINKNLSSDARKTASFIFQLMAYLAETSCFCLLGLSVFSQSIAFFKSDIIFWTLLLILLGRAAHVYPLLSLVRTYVHIILYCTNTMSYKLFYFILFYFILFYECLVNFHVFFFFFINIFIFVIFLFLFSYYKFLSSFSLSSLCKIVIIFFLLIIINLSRIHQSNNCLIISVISSI